MNKVIDLEGEVWKVIDGYPDYMISSQGRVMSTKFGKERLMKQRKNKDGYLQVGLYRKDGRQKQFFTHRLVATMFIKPDPNLDPNNLQVNHLDECKSNNCAENLQWVSARENANYGSRNERMAAKQSKTVYQYTKNGLELVGVYKSTKQAERQNNYANGAISKICNGKRKSKTAYGFIWSYSPLPNTTNQLSLFPLTETKIS